MAIVTRYFSSTSAGAADGTTWSDRAALFSAGNWSTVITGFNFAGSDSLLCLIEGGVSYTCSQSLASGLFANAPSAANNLMLHGCDSSGNAIAPPDHDWTSDQPAWSKSTLPTIESSTNIVVINLSYAHARLISFSGSGNTTNAILGSGSGLFIFDWVYVVNSNNSTSATCVAGTGTRITNSVLQCSGTSYSAIMSNFGEAINVRCIGNPSASSGSRVGIASSATTLHVSKCCTYGNVGQAMSISSSSAAWSGTIERNTLTGVPGTSTGDVLILPSTASQTQVQRIIGNVLVNGGAYGLNAQSAARVYVFNNRLRDNTSGSFNGTLNHDVSQNYTTDTDDTDDFVDFSGGDFRIKNTATIWGKGYGVSDEPAAASSGTAGVVGS